mmetsp:Transcript_14030/g.35418  ORF Transcript_14030/g.35418 Transcript_14030/m.35418 type:complete len:330 (-) Transcript_14030:354-1343(-)
MLRLVSSVSSATFSSFLSTVVASRNLFAADSLCITASLTIHATWRRDTCPPNCVSASLMRTSCALWYSSSGFSIPPGRTMVKGKPLATNASSDLRFQSSTPKKTFRIAAGHPNLPVPRDDTKTKCGALEHCLAASTSRQTPSPSISLGLLGLREFSGAPMQHTTVSTPSRADASCDGDDFVTSKLTTGFKRSPDVAIWSPKVSRNFALSRQPALTLSPGTDRSSLTTRMPVRPVAPATKTVGPSPLVCASSIVPERGTIFAATRPIATLPPVAFPRCCCCCPPLPVLRCRCPTTQCFVRRPAHGHAPTWSNSFTRARPLTAEHFIVLAL